MLPEQFLFTQGGPGGLKGWSPGLHRVLCSKARIFYSWVGAMCFQLTTFST